ncbi:MAG TPA: hypothetical protein VK477_00485, partial [Acidobacteriota bacterium]|nr:hypothetical protein [Acidobacteriota bacterium]
VAVIMGSYGPNRSVDKGRARDLKMIEMLERGFAAVPVPAPGGTSRPTGAVANPPAGHHTGPSIASAGDTIPTVKTDLTPPPAAVSDESSTAKEPAVVFRVIPPVTPPKKP